jgi:hypothetical protein
MNGMTYEQMMEMIGLGGQNSDLEAQIAQQRAQAEALRIGAPEMRQAGRVAVAPHWMEMLGGLARNKVAGDLDKGAMSSNTAMNANKQAQFAQLLRAMSGGQSSAPGGPGFQLPQQKLPGHLGDY